MIVFPSSARVWLAAGRTDMRRGMNGLALRAMIAHQHLQIAKLQRELYHPRSERALRLIDQAELGFEEFEAAVTKAWLFAGSDRGGQRAAAMYSLIVTAKLNDIDPEDWLADVLARTA